MRKRVVLMVLIPIVLMAIGITYANFKSKVNIGMPSDPNIVYTGYMKWRAYLPSELGPAWKSQLPDKTDGVIVHNKYIKIPEKPDVGKIEVSTCGTTSKVTLSNVYPGYVADAHFVYIYSGSVPTKLKDAYISINDPKRISKDLKTLLKMTVDPDGKNGPSQVYEVVMIGYPLSKLPSRIEYWLNHYLGSRTAVFTHGGYIAFCTPPNVTNINVTYDINPDSGLPPELIATLKNTDSFWIMVYPNNKYHLPQNATMSFNLTLLFTQYNE